MYHPSLTNPTSTSDSFWASESPAFALDGAPAEPADSTYDVAIVGGGLTGISTAYHLAQETNLSVCLLDAGAIGRGASGLNAGFCNVSPTQTHRALLDRYGEADARAFIAAQNEGVRTVRALLEKAQIDAQPQLGGTYEVAHSPAAFEKLRVKAELLERVFDVESALVSTDRFAEIGHASPEQFGALHHPAGFALNPLRYVRGLATAAAKRGAVILEGRPVERLERSGDEHVLVAGERAVRARRLVIATNGYTPERLHRSLTARLMPVISHIVTTRPLTPDERSAQGWSTGLVGCATTHGTLFYYRVLPDGRLLFGGPGDTTGRPQDATRTRDRLSQALRSRFPAWRDIEITHSWRGLVCTSRKFAPSVGTADADPTVFYGLGYHGNGVATATWTGRQLAAVVAGGTSLEEAFPRVMRGLGGRFPLPRLRPLYLRAALRLLRLGD
ncbi:MAG: FAD-binding oxidoreductase [bacterium]|nr:FAD-binding oxidoreductase [bacterium]